MYSTSTERTPSSLRRLTLSTALGVVALGLVSCGGEETSNMTVDAGAGSVGTEEFSERLDQIEQAVSDWRNAATIDEAVVAAETAANLVVGLAGPDYGDRNRDSVVHGPTDIGLLPGLDGEPAGLAMELVDNECIRRNVLGGPWDDPRERWDTMTTAIIAWRPNNNTMPSLPSHPMRVVGWAVRTLSTNDLDQAHEYADHAQLHIDITREALDC